MHDFAHRPLGIARRRVAACLLAAAAAAQDLARPPRFAEVDALAVRALEAADPVTRGEAALWLAESGKHEHSQAIAAIARDAAAPARQRGILAVGRLGAPGCESFLGTILLELEPDAADAAIAAFALGQLDDSIPAPAVDTLLRRAQGGSKKRYHALMSALLGGLAARPHPSRATALRAVRDDESNRDQPIILLAQAALVRTGDAPTREQVTGWLTSAHTEFRRHALHSWLREWRPDDRERDRLVRLARGDPDAEVRAGALRVLAQALDQQAIALADRALASRAPAEAAAGAEILLVLAGTARRRAVEDRALDARLPAEIRASLLATLPPPLPPRVLLACHDAAHDADAAAVLRAASACALARADSVLAPAALEVVFFAIDEPRSLTRVAAALRDVDRLTPVAVRLTRKDVATDSEPFAAQLRAVVGIDRDVGLDLVLELASSGRLRDPALGTALAALRTARSPQVSAAVLALLPPAVVALAP